MSSVLPEEGRRKAVEILKADAEEFLSDLAGLNKMKGRQRAAALITDKSSVVTALSLAIVEHGLDVDLEISERTLSDVLFELSNESFGTSARAKSAALVMNAVARHVLDASVEAEKKTSVVDPFADRAPQAPHREVPPQRLETKPAIQTAPARPPQIKNPEKQTSTPQDSTNSVSKIVRSEILHDRTGEMIWTHVIDGQKSGPRFSSGELIKLPSILPPPPAGSDGGMLNAWLEGSVAHSMMINLRLSFAKGESMDDIMEMQSELYASPDSALQTYRSRPPANYAQALKDAEELHFRSNLGWYGVPYDTCADLLSEAFQSHMTLREPRNNEFLTRIGYSLTFHSDLVDSVCSALNIEGYFLSDTPKDADRGSIADVRGSISPSHRLDRPSVLERAVYLHMTSGQPMASSLKSALTELRHAQFSRFVGRDISSSKFDNKFNKDWSLRLDEYILKPEDEVLDKKSGSREKDEMTIPF